MRHGIQRSSDATATIGDDSFVAARFVQAVGDLVVGTKGIQAHHQVETAEAGRPRDVGGLVTLRRQDVNDSQLWVGQSGLDLFFADEQVGPGASGEGHRRIGARGLCSSGPPAGRQAAYGSMPQAYTTTSASLEMPLSLRRRLNRSGGTIALS